MSGVKVPSNTETINNSKVVRIVYPNGDTAVILTCAEYIHSVEDIKLEPATMEEYYTEHPTHAN